MGFRCRQPIKIEPVLEDPTQVRKLLEGTAPHYPVQRYFTNAAEMRSQSGPGEMIIVSNFRGDWATLEDKVDGIDPLLNHDGFRQAAARLFESDHVVPWGLYSNITWQIPFDQGAGHTDVPAFVGVDRTEYPTWFLNVMGHSGLFEEERVDIATAVSWFYRGNDGGFSYWPDGPSQDAQLHEGDIFNTALMGDNDRMYHRVRPTGDRSKGLLGGLSLSSRLEHDGEDRWAIRTDGTTHAEMAFDKLRISVSWKAYVYRNEEQRRRHESGSDGLSLDEVMGRFLKDLKTRGASSTPPTDPLHEEEFIQRLTGAYVNSPQS